MKANTRLPSGIALLIFSRHPRAASTIEQILRTKNIGLKKELRILNNILEGKQLPVYGQGTNVRDWLYVEDHCKAIDLVVTKGKDGSIYNVGGHNERQNIQIVKIIIRTIRRLMEENPQFRVLLKRQDGLEWINDDLISFVKDRLGHDQRYGIDPSKIKADLGWFPETTFEVGIEKTIRWNLEHHDWIEDVSGEDYQEYYERMYK